MEQSIKNKFNYIVGLKIRLTFTFYVINLFFFRIKNMYENNSFSAAEQIFIK